MTYLKQALLGSVSLSMLAFSPALAQTENTFLYPIQVGGPLTDVIDGYVADFHEQHPDIRVEAVFSGNYTETTTRPLTAARSGTPPAAAAGKSTLIRCVNRLVEPTSGSVRLAGKEIVSMGRGDLRRARRRMGMIFQEYALVERLSVMENVLSGQLGNVGFWRSYFRRYPQSAVDEAFRLLGRVGLDHMVDKRADALSGGQRQRVGIARALIQDPEILLVDEPTASLDPKTSRQIMRLITELCRERGLGAIINIHDVPLAMMFVERIVGLRAGQIVYDGPPKGLTDDRLTEIYGEEDWSGTSPDDDDDAPSHKPVTAAVDIPELQKAAQG